MQKPELPNWRSLDIKALSEIFRNRDTSYKFLWMRGILHIIKQGRCRNNVIPERLLVACMLDLAKYPLRRFRMSLGYKDKINEILLQLAELENWRHLETDALDCNITARFNDIPDFIYRRLVDFVPYRLLSPFLPGKSLRNLGKYALHRKIIALADRRFDSSNPPLYRLLAGKRAIELHPLWRDYLKRNMPVVEAWAKWHWAGYLQGCNPNVPAIQNKLEKPDRRRSLTKERAFWRWVIGSHGAIKCIFSGQILSATNFSLDHYVPRDFIAHDQMWNLSPVTRRMNEKKSGMLPPDQCLEEFIRLQHVGLSTYHSKKPDNYKVLMESYLANLGVSVWRNSPPALEDLTRAYSRVIPPLLQLARNSGFETWENHGGL